jgi:hypothetical protein
VEGERVGRLSGGGERLEGGLRRSGAVTGGENCFGTTVVGGGGDLATTFVGWEDGLGITVVGEEVAGGRGRVEAARRVGRVRTGYKARQGELKVDLVVSALEVDRRIPDGRRERPRRGGW